jgi:hypothetical protein
MFCLKTPLAFLFIDCEELPLWLAELLSETAPLAVEGRG